MITGMKNRNEKNNITSLHCFALHCLALHCKILHYIALHYVALHYVALDCIALHCKRLHQITLHYIALDCIGCTRLHHITLDELHIYNMSSYFVALTGKIRRGPICDPKNFQEPQNRCKEGGQEVQERGKDKPKTQSCRYLMN